MTKGVRIALWTLSSLAVLWTIVAVTGLFTMGGMMGQGGTMQGLPTGGMMAVMLGMGLTWLIMLGLDAVFVHLVVGALRARRAE